jgi:hypothetical protein
MYIYYATVAGFDFCTVEHCPPPVSVYYYSSGDRWNTKKMMNFAVSTSNIHKAPNQN